MNFLNSRGKLKYSFPFLVLDSFKIIFHHYHFNVFTPQIPMELCAGHSEISENTKVNKIMLLLAIKVLSQMDAAGDLAGKPE